MEVSVSEVLVVKVAVPLEYPPTLPVEVEIWPRTIAAATVNSEIKCADDLMYLVFVVFVISLSMPLSLDRKSRRFAAWDQHRWAGRWDGGAGWEAPRSI
jgi:hypothetical protein